MKEFLCIIAMLVFAVISWGAPMNSPIKQVQQFQIVGIAVRTSNAKEMTSGGEIPRQWQKFFQEGLLARIPHKVDSTIYAVYTGYADHRAGEYTFLIGARVNDASVVPPGLAAVTIPAGKYAVITSAKGPVQNVVPQAWQQIWQMEDHSTLGGNRAYQADYEVYDQRSQNPQDSQVDIYVGLRP